MVPVNLLTLPYLTISKILYYLDSITLRKLRQVNHTTKSWVENESKLLESLKIQIINGYHLNDIIKSNVPWNNFIILNHNPWNDEFVGSNKFICFLTKFGQSIKNLVISSSRLNSANILHHLQCIGPQLEYLCIETIPSSPGKFFESPPMMVNTEPKIFYNLKCLDYISNDDSLDVEAMILWSLLPCCPNLKKIRFSRLYLSGYTDKMQSKINSCKIIYEPLIKYLKMRVELNGTNNNNNELIIELSGSNSFVNLLIYRESFPMNYITLLEIVQLCSLIGAKLYNVPSSSLPALKECIHLTRKQVYDFENVIQSITVLNKKKGLQHIYIPTLSKISIIINTESKKDFTKFELRGQIKIIKLFLGEFFFTTCIGMNNLYQNLFYVYRPSMEELIVHKTNLDYFANGLMLSTNFPNLKKLSLTLWGDNTEGFQILIKGLPHLEKLNFFTCKNCTDEALLGKDFKNPLICQLKKLVHLELVDTSITDLTFQHALCLMKLKRFLWSNDDSVTDLVTFEGGISKLSNVENGFRDSVEIFECKLQLPQQCSYKDWDILTSSFRCLKFSSNLTYY